MTSDLCVTILTRRGAERWARLVYNVPDGVGLGWRPYRYLVQSNGGTLPHTAFVERADFRRWLAANGYRLARLWRRHPEGAWAVATGWLNS